MTQRHRYGGGAADFVTDGNGNVKTLKQIHAFFDEALTTAATDLLQWDGTAWPASAVKSTSTGQVKVQGPDGYAGPLYVAVRNSDDSYTPPVRIDPADLAARLDAAEQGGLGGGAALGSATPAGTVNGAGTVGTSVQASHEDHGHSLTAHDHSDSTRGGNIPQASVTGLPTALAAKALATDLTTHEGSADHDAHNDTRYARLAGATFTGAVSGPEPTQSSHLVTKGYADALAAGLSTKQSAKVLATANTTRSGLQTIDGYTLLDGDRVLLIGQTTTLQNGLWVAHSGAWSRPTDFAAGADVTGAYVFVVGGTLGAGSGWTVQGPTPVIVDTNAETWAQFNGAGQINAGTGLTKTGNTLAADFGTASGKVAQGNDARFTDQRTPTDASVTPAKLAAAAIDPVAGVAGARTLGTGAQQAMAGNDSRVIAAAVDTAVVHKSGDTMTGALVLSADASAALHPVTKQQADGSYLGKPLGLTGATSATRYVGGTASGPPSSGTFAAGDYIVDLTGQIYVCVTAGTPGTWQVAGAGFELAYSFTDATVDVAAVSNTMTSFPTLSVDVPATSRVVELVLMVPTVTSNTGTVANGTIYGAQFTINDAAEAQVAGAIGMVSMIAGTLTSKVWNLSAVARGRLAAPVSAATYHAKYGMINAAPSGLTSLKANVSAAPGNRISLTAIAR